MRSTGRLDGDHAEPTPEEVEAWQRRSGPPDNEVPAVVPVATVLGRSDDVAVLLTGLRAHSTGLAIDVGVRLRTEWRDPSGAEVFDLVSGGRYGIDVDADRLLLLGVEDSAGRTATTLHRPDWPGEPDTGGPLLAPTGGGGGGRTYDQGYWLHPLPPPGDLLVVCRWAAYGVEETRTVLDGTAIAEAAGRVEELWPWQPPHSEPPEPRVPPTPASGWFADAVRRDRVREAAERLMAENADLLERLGRGPEDPHD